MARRLRSATAVMSTTALATSAASTNRQLVLRPPSTGTDRKNHTRDRGAPRLRRSATSVGGSRRATAAPGRDERWGPRRATAAPERDERWGSRRATATPGRDERWGVWGAISGPPIQTDRYARRSDSSA